MIPRIKICCISSIDEAAMAIRFGASALGLVGPMPSGPGVIGDDIIKEIAAVVPPPIATFLLSSETAANKIIDHHRRTQTNTIQLVDAVEEATYTKLRATLPAVKIVQVVHVINEQSVDEALRIAEEVDALLLDSGNPTLAVKVLGGTGKVHNWKLSRRIVAQANKPVFLAGGISAANVQQAIEEVQPFGLDLCSSVRTNNALDAKKLEAFFAKVAACGYNKF